MKNKLGMKILSLVLGVVGSSPFADGHNMTKINKKNIRENEEYVDDGCLEENGFGFGEVAGLTFLGSILYVLTRSGEIPLKYDYGPYISNRVLSGMELGKMRELIGDLTAIPYCNDNCYASIAMCMIADPRDINIRLEQLNRGVNSYRMSEFRTFISDLSKLIGNKGVDRKPFLDKWTNRVKYMCELSKKNEVPLMNNLEGIYADLREKHRKDTSDCVFFFERMFSDLDIPYGNLDCRRFGRMDMNHEVDDLADIRIGPDFKLVNALNMGNLPLGDGSGFSVERYGHGLGREVDPCGRILLQNKYYLVSDIVVYDSWCSHWYEDVIVYDKNTLDNEAPRIIAILQKDNLKPDRVITGSDIKRELERIVRYGIFYRFRMISDDNKNVYSI